MMKIATIKNRLQQYKEAITNLGLFPSIIYKLNQLRNRHTRIMKPFILYSRYAKYPLKCRPNTSDIDAFSQIFVSREYRCLDDISDAGLIIDCGANVGFSSAYFLSRFPTAYLIAVEPDPQNYSMLENNLAPYESRYRTICSAIWSHPTDLVLSEVPFADGREWARTVRETRKGDSATMSAKDVGTLLKDSGYERISILKIDIEGAESVIFSSNYETWIGQVDNLVIELHSDECRSIFRKAISNVSFSVSECDELTVCRLNCRSDR